MVILSVGWELCTYPKLKDFLFSSRSFTVLAFNHFKFILCMVEGKG